MDIRLIRSRIMARYSDRVVDVENEGMDEGRFFVHLKQPWTYDDGNGIQRTRSFGSFAEVRRVMKTVSVEDAS